jgi:MFS family permease
MGFLGLALGLIVGVGGATGSWLGGWLADKFGVKDLRAYMVAPAIASLVTIPIYITAVTVDSAVLGILMLAANALLGTIWYGPVYGTAQSIVPPHMRATTAAILLFIINLIGLVSARWPLASSPIGSTMTWAWARPRASAGR